MLTNEIFNCTEFHIDDIWYKNESEKDIYVSVVHTIHSEFKDTPYLNKYMDDAKDEMEDDNTELQPTCSNEEDPFECIYSVTPSELISSQKNDNFKLPFTVEAPNYTVSSHSQLKQDELQDEQFEIDKQNDIYQEIANYEPEINQTDIPIEEQMQSDINVEEHVQKDSVTKEHTIGNNSNQIIPPMKNKKKKKEKTKSSVEINEATILNIVL